MAATSPSTSWLPVAEAASALGVSVSAIRRGLKSGRYRGQRQPTPQGFTWLIEVPGDRVGDGRIGDRVGGDRAADTRIGDGQAPGATETTILAQRADEMARYSRTLLEPYVAKIEAQAERIGRLEEQLEQVKAALAARDNGAGPGGDSTARRPWWRWWG